jgi:tRNA threonylcarbamoyladenosine biosynthesis protein TsaB
MLLALDTATSTASLALYDLDNDHLLAEVTWQARRRQTQDLLVTANNLFRLVDLTPDALTALAVTTGPGSFTGVRISISVVKGMGLGLPRPPLIVGLPTVAVTAAPWFDAAGSAPGVRICACIQAGRGRYNWAWFTGADRLARPAAHAHHAGTTDELAAELTAHVSEPAWLCGEIAPDLTEAVGVLAHVTVLDNVSGLRRAGHLARLAAAHLAAGTHDALETLQPIYLRAP